MLVVEQKTIESFNIQIVTSIELSDISHYWEDAVVVWVPDYESVFFYLPACCLQELLREAVLMDVGMDPDGVSYIADFLFPDQSDTGPAPIFQHMKAALAAS